MVDQQLFGLVEWFPNHCCDYHFFRRVIIQEQTGLDEEFHDTMFDWSQIKHIGNATEHIGQRKVVLHDTGTHTHRIARHRHSVINAIRTSIGNSRVVMPLAVTEMLKEIPDWLYSSIEVIDGLIIREQVIEKDTRVEHWEQPIALPGRANLRS